MAPAPYSMIATTSVPMELRETWKGGAMFHHLQRLHGGLAAGGGFIAEGHAIKSLSSVAKARKPRFIKDPCYGNLNKVP